MFESRFATALALLTFGLIVYGGVVHNTESSLACPDWPLCYGEIFPDPGNGREIEMGHRLAAAGVGLLTIAFAVAASARKRFAPPFVRLGFLAVALIVFQGGLGAVAVLYRLPTMVSTAHLAISLVFLSTLILLATRSRYSLEGPPPPLLRERVVPLAGMLKLVLTALSIQILLGAFVRHTGSGAAAGIGPDASVLGIDPGTGKASLWPAGIPAELNMLHRYLAVVVMVLTVGAAGRMYRMGRVAENDRLMRLAAASMALVVLQVAAGILSIRSFLGVGPVTAHLALGTLLYAALFTSYLYVRYLMNPYDYRREAAPARAPRSAAIDGLPVAH